MPAAWAGVAVSAASAIAGAASAGGASDTIGGASAQAQQLDEQARQEGRANYGTATSNVQPYISTGQSAVSRAADLAGLNGQDAANAAMASFQSSPGYGYQLQQGLKAVDAGAAAQGLLRSGATLRAEQTLGSNLANAEFSNYMGRLNSLAGLGIQGSSLFNQATGQFNDLLTKTTTDQTGTIAGAARNQANLDIYGTNSLANGFGGAVSEAKKNDLFGLATSGSGFNFNGAGTSTPTIGALTTTTGRGSGNFNTTF